MMKRLILITTCALAGVGGAYAMWPTPRPPLKVAAAYAVRAPQPRCQDVKIVTLIRQMEQTRYWHMEIGYGDWLTSRHFNAGVYRPYAGDIEIGPADAGDNLQRLHAPDVEPVCRWDLDRAMKALAGAMGPERKEGGE